MRPGVALHPGIRWMGRLSCTGGAEVYPRAARARSGVGRLLLTEHASPPPPVFGKILHLKELDGRFRRKPSWHWTYKQDPHTEGLAGLYPFDFRFRVVRPE